MKVKEQGQVFTPKHIAEDILEIAEYDGEKILKKHVIDNSCGEGVFLLLFAERYIKAYLDKNKTSNGLKKELEKYIHGIEKDPKIYKTCVKNLENLAEKYGLSPIKWDVVNGDTLDIDKYTGKMDYVIGNPPYVRVHNLKEQLSNVKQYSFCEGGMTDLYLVFFEIGIDMLSKNGVLCYITPNSFCNSLAGTKLRKYLQYNRNIECLYDLGHYQPFTVTAYTMISKIHKNKKFDFCKYYKYDIKTEKPNYVCDIEYDNLFLKGDIVLSNYNEKFLKHLNYEVSNNSKVQVKNGFATLNDKFFISDSFDFTDNVIDVIKASTGQWKKCIYPYDSNGNTIPFSKLNTKLQKYYNANKDKLTKDSKDKSWYEFGRSQAIKDVNKKKITINTTIKDIDSIKINEVGKGKGVYSGLYMLTDVPLNTIKEKLCSEKFIDYLKAINKCKRGGYLTFSSKDLAKYINCELE